MREADIAVDEAAFEAMGIAELLALSRQAGLVNLEELDCRGTGAVVQAEVEARYDESRLDALSFVEAWEHVTETADGHLYVIDFTAPGLPDELGEASEALLGTCDPEVDDDATTLSLVGRQRAIAAVVEAYEAGGVSPELERLGPYEGSSDPLDRLTDRQREVIATAHELGFYEVPRTVSTADIADELDLDASTVAEHLQRAERNLFDDVLS
ncbi:MAG: helix-turn-helix domain-containing protein [Halobacteriota archaeon]